MVQWLTPVLHTESVPWYSGPFVGLYRPGTRLGLLMMSWPWRYPGLKALDDNSALISDT